MKTKNDKQRTSAEAVTVDCHIGMLRLHAPPLEELWDWRRRGRQNE